MRKRRYSVFASCFAFLLPFMLLLHKTGAAHTIVHKHIISLNKKQHSTNTSVSNATPLQDITVNCGLSPQGKNKVARFLARTKALLDFSVMDTPTICAYCPVVVFSYKEYYNRYQYFISRNIRAVYQLRGPPALLS